MSEKLMLLPADSPLHPPSFFFFFSQQLKANETYLKQVINFYMNARVTAFHVGMSLFCI